MTTLHLKLKVTADRQLKIDLPPTVEPGDELEITIELPDSTAQAWTEDELREVMQPDPKTGAEIVAMLQEMGSEGWDHIEDGAEWVEEQRRKRQERNRWSAL